MMRLVYLFRPRVRHHREKIKAYAIEALEPRRLLTVFTVINTNDTGAGSLRDAITQANANAGLDIIKFQIPGSGFQTILPASQLPEITGPVEIHGETQPGYNSSDQPLIAIDGALAGNSYGLEFSAGGNLVEGLDIRNFAYDGIIFVDTSVDQDAGGNTVFENYIGTDSDGLTAKSNGQSGIHLIYSPDDLIEDNLISGNSQSGIFVADKFSDGTRIIGNKIGTDITGDVALGNGLDGIALGAPPSPSPGDGYASGITVGGTDFGDANTISGNAYSGIWIEGGVGNVVQQNYIGTDAGGLFPVANGYGTDSFLASTYGTDGIDIVNATGTVIGGGASGARNVISSNTSNGVSIRGNAATGNVISGNYIGTDFSTTNTDANGGYGVLISDAPGNIIGGTDSGTANIISGNASNGVEIVGSHATLNTVEGNFIGLQRDGFDKKPNGGSGVYIDGASYNTIGGTTVGAKNVISDNAISGVVIAGTAAIGNQVLGNSIGLDVSGLLGEANTYDGVDILDGSQNVIGGTSVAARNIISGNGQNGVLIAGNTATGNLVEGDYIGTTFDGFLGQANAYSGVVITKLTDATIGTGAATGNIIGGTAAGAGDLISGNTQYGVRLSSGATGNLVEGDYIGTNAAGIGPLPNYGGGVLISSGATVNTIGGGAPGARNVISGNIGWGVYITGNLSIGNIVSGNYIGTDVTGLKAIANANDGVGIFDSALNVIGGLTDAARNIISGNTGSGVVIAGIDATQNIVEGNYIGTDVTGLAKCSNGADGVYITTLTVGDADTPTGAASDNVVGGTVAGSRNVISGNATNGVQLSGSTTGNIVESDYIGVNSAGVAAVANTQEGVLISNGASDNTIGGDAGNVISGNLSDGVEITGLATIANVIAGNFIGTSFAGLFAVANGLDGVDIFNAFFNLIGGTAANGNLISGNKGNGIVMAGGGASTNSIQGNNIGLNATEATAIANGGDGILVTTLNDPNVGTGAATNDLIGGVGDLGNVISGNTKSGIEIKSGASQITVEGNHIGTDVTGTNVIANQGDGVLIDSSFNNKIGDATANLGNEIAGNLQDGVEISGSTAQNNLIQDNFIGTDSTATLQLGNQRYGVEADNDANQNSIGGAVIHQPNTIAFNGGSLGAKGYGVVVPFGDSDSIRGDSIFNNGGRGIVLVDSQNPFGFVVPGSPIVVGMNPVSGDATKTDILWQLHGTPNTVYNIDFYSNIAPSPSGFGDGHTYVTTSSVTTDANGFAAFEGIFHADEKFISATATDNAGNTSEFSMVDSDADGIADAWETTGIDFNEDGTVDFTLPGANPYRKDVFVEIDSMQGDQPYTDALNDVIAAFAKAPVGNPDGSTGITLHLENDETMDTQEWVGRLLNDGTPDPTDPLNQDPFLWFNAVKQNGINGVGGFGTAAERANPLALDAKALVYRYTIFADTFATTRSDSPGISTTTSGIAENNGNDIIIAAHAWGSQNDTVDYEAGTFMHELGHSLGLDHGGNDAINFKENYQSVMNYKWQVPTAWMYEDTNHNGIQDPGETDINGNGTFGDTTWSLNYSGMVDPTLNENALVESAGIGGIAGDWETIPGRRIIPTSGPVDWNGTSSTANSAIDLNKDGALTTMTGYDDWASLRYYFLDSPGTADGGLDITDDSDGETLEQWEAGNAEGTGNGLLQFQTTSSNVAENAYGATFTVIRGAGTKGAVTVDYSTSDGTAIAGVDYYATSGMLTFADGEYVQTFYVPIIDAGLPSGTKNLTLTLSNPTGGAELLPNSSTTLNITDNDPINIYAVTNTNDDGPGSLRQAINDSNSNPNGQYRNVITFDIGNGGVQTIKLLSVLPQISASVDIDATTQPGYAGKPIIELDGENVGGNAFVLLASNVTIRGFDINRFTTGSAVAAYQGSTYAAYDFDVVGNYIGTDITGTIAEGNLDGISVYGGSGTVGGPNAADRNVISGNLDDGIYTRQDYFLNVQGNYIGTAADGTSALGNAVDGIRLDLYALPSQRAENVAVGGLNAGDGNVIAFNGDDGIRDTSNGGYDYTRNLNYAAGNVYLSNLIYGNAHLGISESYSTEFLHLVAPDDGLTVQNINDATGANDGYKNPQNYPVLQSALSSGGQTTITGYLDSQPYGTYTLQFFSNPSVSGIGYGQGRTLLGTTTVYADANGHVNFTADLGVSVANGQLITATASGYGTSDFSERIAVGDVLGNVFVVNTTDDTDDGAYNPAHVTLRDAILAANAHPGLDTIKFAIGSGVQTISPLTALPVITDAVIIDGTTQPGFAGKPLIVLNGALAERSSLSGSPDPEVGLLFDTGNSTLKGLVIDNFFAPNYYGDGTISGGYGFGLIMEGNNNVLQGTYIGTDVTGTVAAPNAYGASILGSGDHVGGSTAAERNVFSGNVYQGLGVYGPDASTSPAPSDENVVQGNYIGTDVTGTFAVPNGQSGIQGAGIQISGETILGGPGAGEGNVISANTGIGLDVYGGGGSVIQGNLIGTDFTGTKKLGNGEQGIYTVATNDAGPGVLIGGTQPGDGNVVSNSGGTGIVITQNFTVIQGNKIGTDITGTLNFGNGIGTNDAGSGAFAGMIVSATNCLIGGSQPGAGNIISASRGDGLIVAESTVPNLATDVIQGNYIGTQADGVSPLGNGADGISIGGGATDYDANEPTAAENIIGGLDPGEANTIAYNGRDGIVLSYYLGYVGQIADQHVELLSNSIFSNAKLGIDLGDNGVSLNDTDDTDTGSNDLLNFPVLTTVATDGTRTTVTGTYNSAPNSYYQLQFFSNTAADPSGYGEGQILLGTRQVHTDASGNATFTVTFAVGVTTGEYLTATATDMVNNDTSEFSASLVFVSGMTVGNQPPVSDAGGPYTINEGDPLKLNGSHSDDPDGDPLTYSWDINGDGVYGDATGAKPTLTWAQLNALGIVNGPSSFNVSLRVDDGHGHVVTSATTLLTVLNVAPTAVINFDSNNTYNEGDPVVLTGSYADPGTADTLTLKWHVDADNGQTIADSSAPNFTFTPDDNGNYTVTFTVTDSDGASTSDVEPVYVYDIPPTPTINGLPAQGTVGVPVNLTSTVIDPSSIDTADGFSYDWYVYSKADNTSTEVYTANDSFTPAVAGEYDIYLYVQDKDGYGYSTQAQLTVTDAGGGGSTDTTPVVTLGANAETKEGSPYTSTGSFTDPDAGDSWTATVNYGDGSGDQALTLNANKTFDLSHTYADNGAFDVTVNVTDSAGQIGTQKTHVTVDNVPPTITLGDPPALSVGSPLTLAGSFADPGADTWTATVDYGDGTGAQALTLAANKTFQLNHTYQSSDSFTITVTVTDKDGGSDTVTRTANVGKLGTSLVANAATGTYGGTTTLSASLANAGSPLVGKTLTFQLGGATVGTAVTGADGVATLSNVSLGTLAAGSVGITVSFAGDAGYANANNTAVLTIAKATAPIVLSNLTQIYTGLVESPTAGTTPTGLAVVFTYTQGSAAVTNPTNVGTYSVTATINDPNYQGSITGTFTITKATAPIGLSNLTQTYSGLAESPTATTTPTGLAVVFTYLQGSTVVVSPTNAGTYSVTATINDPNYQGSATGTFTITKATAPIALSNLTQAYTGSPISPTSTTTPAGLAVIYTYTQNAVAVTNPTAVGAYSVTATINDPNYQGSTTGTLTIVQPNASIQLSNLTQTYTGLAEAPTATTTPGNLAVTFTYTQGSTAIASPINAGTYNVTATINDPNYQGSVTGVFTITKATAPIGLSNLTQTYTGLAESPTATTTPSGLAVTFTYMQGSTVVANPTNAGAYDVTATINDPNYQGSTTGVLTISKATAPIELSNLTQTYTGLPESPTATTTPSGLAVVYTYTQGSTVVTTPTNVGAYDVTATISDPNYQGNVTGVFTITKAIAPIGLSNLTQTYTGFALTPTALTTPTGLAVTYTYTQGSTVVTNPTNVGTYSVTATIDDANYQGSTTGTLTITKATAGVTLTNLTQAYTGAPEFASSTTTPTGLAVTYVYTQGNTVVTNPTAVGAYNVVATINDPNYQGGATGTLTIIQPNAAIVLSNLTQTYTGLAESPTATTTPGNLAVTYVFMQGSTVVASPINAGVYSVTATINDPNYQGSTTGTFTITKAVAPVALSNLTQTYTGLPEAPTATTTPTGLAVTFTYMQGSTVIASPTNAGTYSVTATINDPNYQGSTTGTLTIARATAPIVLSNPTQTYTGLAEAPTATTTPSGLAVTYVFTQGSTVVTGPTNAGTYSVVATINDPNYQGSATGTLTINKATAAITLSNLTQAYTGSPEYASSTTSPVGLAVTYVYTQGNTVIASPTNAGSYTVVATINNANYQGTATGTLVITSAKKTAKVTLCDLYQTYTGSAKFATATTSPCGLKVTFVYMQGNTVVTSPINAGTYTVIATVNDPNYTGSATGTLVIAKANARITLSNLSQLYSGLPEYATATTNPAGLGVTIVYKQGTTVIAQPTKIGSYCVTATVNNPNYNASTVTGTLVIKGPTTFSNLLAPTVVLNTPAVTLGGTVNCMTGLPQPTGSVTIAVYVGGKVKASQSVSVNSKGGFSATFRSIFTAVGQYTVVYSYCGNSYYAATSSTVTGSITYGLKALCSQTSPAKAGSTVAVKVSLVDANGSNAGGSSESIKVAGIAPASHPSAITAAPAGNSSVFSYSQGVYTLNLTTTGLSKGTYLLYLLAAGDPIMHSLQFILN